jgi:hypothetical protein
MFSHHSHNSYITGAVRVKKTERVISDFVTVNKGQVYARLGALTC